MKFVCEAGLLSEAVANVSRSVCTKATIPALEGILISTDTNRIILSGYDLELAIKTSVDAVVEEEGCAVLNARLFGEIIRKSGTSRISVAVDERLNAVITSGETEFTVMAANPNDFPELPEISDEKMLEIDCEILKSMVTQTIFAVATSEIRPVHTGILFEVEQDNIRLIAVDGYRLAVRNEKIKTDTQMKFIVPAKALHELLKLIGDDDKTVKFNVGRRHVSFDIGAFFVISRLLDGDFLDYNTAVVPGATLTVLAKTKDLIDAVDRISLLITDRIKSPVRCTFEDQKAFVRCTTTIGKASDVVSCETTGDPVEIGFNNRYFLDAMRAVDCDVVKLELNGAASPIKIMPTDSDSFLFLVVPVRLKAEN